MATVWGEIAGRQITFPVEVDDANVATLMFGVPSAAAAALLPGAAFEIAETAPGTAQLVLAACDYRQNPWGSYNEINLGFLARPTGAPPETVGSFVYRMPVNQQFTCSAGRAVMGFPKTVEEIPIEYTEATVAFRLVMAGRLAFALTLPRVPASGPPQRIEALTYSYLDGRPHVTPLSMDMGTGAVDDPSDVAFELGEGPVAEELRSLGLPRPPDFCVWGEGLTATFALGQPL
ncbi:MAG TPA: acetoacetate decarboxylase family protein [Mycobacteriales bacterium]|nr:acetoacetate decarboxylase family protein [Mycobacteriales bacterium]